MMETKIKYGAVIFEWIAKWLSTVEKRKTSGKSLPKMYYGRFISIVLKKLLKKEIGDKEGEPLNGNKKIKKKLFESWKRNLVEILKSKQLEGSERTVSDVQKPAKKEKVKRKLTEVEEE